MTREEAIETLKANYPDACYEQLREAVDTAIEALKAQPDLQPTCNQLATDTISRQAAIELIERLKPYHQEADDIAEMIDNMPSAQPVLDRTKISDLLERIYSIQSVHLSVEGVLARKYYCKQLWMELFGSEDVPTWID